MADFQKAYALTMGHEGGYANNPLDTGGETYKGISRNNWPTWEGWATIDLVKRVVGPASYDLTMSRDKALQTAVLAFYKKEFWDVLCLDQINSQAIAEEVFDTGVNMHYTVAAKFLQEAVVLSLGLGTLTIDGKIGPKTVAAVNSHPSPQLLVRMLNVMQGARYLDILRRKPNQKVFARSWFSRTVTA